jgi:oligoribonuclease
VLHYRGSPLLHSTLLHITLLQSGAFSFPYCDVVFFMSNDKNLIWIDLEMTGLDTDNDHIIEIATIVTDSDLNVLGEGPVFAVFQPDSVLAKMDEWNTRQHGQSGLTERVRNSKTDMRAAELATIEFLRQHVPAGKSPMCGNSICQDRRFLAREMPELERFFHYRNLDVSTLKELAKRWRPDIAAGLSKDSTHLALDDIRESIAELKYYRDTFLRLA